MNRTFCAYCYISVNHDDLIFELESLGIEAGPNLHITLFPPTDISLNAKAKLISQLSMVAEYAREEGMCCTIARGAQFELYGSYVALPVAVTEKLSELHRRVVNVFSDVADADYQFAEFKPHVTVSTDAGMITKITRLGNDYPISISIAGKLQLKFGIKEYNL